MSSWENVIRSLRDAVNQSPDNIDLRVHLADLLMERRQYQEAIHEYRIALDSRPTDSGIRYALADAYFRFNKYDVAIVILDRYIIPDAVNTLFYDPAFILLTVILGGVIGAVITHFSDRVKRLLVARRYQDFVTRQCAENAFLEEEVFNTRQRTGIMIFVSFFEHEVIVMADSGINKVVDQSQWDNIVQEIIKDIRDGKLVEALENGIKKCGDILLEKGFRKTGDDVNELRDDLRI